MWSDTEVARAAATAGAEVVRKRFGTVLERVGKGGGDFATAADIEAEHAILAVLREHRPQDAVLGEETGRTGADGNRLWLVDPLCGTLNFASGGMLAAVNVALREGGEVTAAAVADPFSGEVFHTGDTAALRPSSATGLVDVNLDPPFPNAPGFRATDLLANPAFQARFRPRVISTSLAATWVAVGRRAAYVTDGHDAGNVHFAAAVALCRAAGCVVTPIKDGIGLLIAADAETHAALGAMLGGR